MIVIGTPTSIKRVSFNVWVLLSSPSVVVLKDEKDVFKICFWSKVNHKPVETKKD